MINACSMWPSIPGRANDHGGGGMPDRLRARVRPRVEPLVAAAQLVEKTQLTDPTLFQAEKWQEEAWGFHDCADEETEILTEDGWRRHDALHVGARVLTLDHDTGSSGWEPVLNVFRYQVTD